jgi:hypothetical protein
MVEEMRERLACGAAIWMRGGVNLDEKVSPDA